MSISAAVHRIIIIIITLAFTINAYTQAGNNNTTYDAVGRYNRRCVGRCFILLLLLFKRLQSLQYCNYLASWDFVNGTS